MSMKVSLFFQGKNETLLDKFVVYHLPDLPNTNTQKGYLCVHSCCRIFVHCMKMYVFL